MEGKMAAPVDGSTLNKFPNGDAPTSPFQSARRAVSFDTGDENNPQALETQTSSPLLSSVYCRPAADQNSRKDGVAKLSSTSFPSIPNNYLISSTATDKSGKASTPPSKFTDDSRSAEKRKKPLFVSPLFKFKKSPPLSTGGPSNSPDLEHLHAYVTKPLEQIAAVVQSDKSQLHSKVTAARENAEATKMGILFEEGLASLLRTTGSIELLVEYFDSSLYPEEFAESFLRDEMENHSVLTTLAYLIEMEVQSAECENSFRRITFYKRVCQSYFFERLSPQLKSIREGILQRRNFCIPKEVLGKLTVIDPSFRLFLKESFDSIYQNLELPQDVAKLMQHRYQLLKKRFPDKAMPISGDLIFLRILNPFISDPDSLSQSQMDDCKQLVRALQKIASEQYFVKREEDKQEDIESINLWIAECIKGHRKFMQEHIDPILLFKSELTLNF